MFPFLLFLVPTLAFATILQHKNKLIVCVAHLIPNVRPNTHKDTTYYHLKLKEVMRLYIYT